MIENRPRQTIRLEEMNPSGNRVGFIDAVYNDGLLFLKQIRVNRNVRNMGYGRNLITRLLNLGQNLGANRLEGNFRPDKGAYLKARIFYQRMGINIFGGMLSRPI